MKHNPEKCLTKVEIFKTLPQEVKEKLSTISTHQILYKKGRLIRSMGEAGGLLVIDRGCAKVFNLDEEGNEVVLNILQEGEIEGEGDLFRDSKSNTFIEALEDTQICGIDRNKFQIFLKENPEVALKLLNNFGQKIVQTQRHELLKSVLDAKKRIWEYLKDISIKSGEKEFSLRLKKKDIAAYLGMSPETFSRKLKELEKEGVIEVRGKKVKLR
ncbi:Crp/Fnr family transcriptional regulator [Lactobacillus sp. PV012]|uniref:Crp/Fnr family transcriptional regulator n=1 Tax=Lactobacillus sp. PV012 TaxID=2594494 RepID=UPI0022401B92|nr:Crp/Fnr family transcriptional regulator [Lactobacillus sp. PV012]QNQ81584.1 Crp/Fnr family transcriptional regulator [Lactobacillus sp. PV012]